MYIIKFPFVTGISEDSKHLIITRCGSGAGPEVKGTLPHIFMISPSGWKVSSQALLTSSDIVKYPAWNHSAISWLLNGPGMVSTNTQREKEKEIQVELTGNKRAQVPVKVTHQRFLSFSFTCLDWQLTYINTVALSISESLQWLWCSSK